MYTIRHNQVYTCVHCEVVAHMYIVKLVYTCTSYEITCFKQLTNVAMKCIKRYETHYTSKHDKQKNKS